MSNQRAIVVGAGMVGLSTAWFLQRRGFEVAVLDRRGVAAGSSLGNAGLLTPTLITPLPAPKLLRTGPSMLVNPRSPLYVPPTLDRSILSFLAGFTRHCTAGHWRRAATVLGQAGARSLSAYEEMQADSLAPVAAETRPAEPFLDVFSTVAERDALVEEFSHLSRLGFPARFTLLDREQTHALAPALSDQARLGLALEDQRFLNPSGFVHAVADAVRAGGGEIVGESQVTDVRQSGAEVRVALSDGRTHTGQVAVIATGSWLDSLTRPHGVSRIVQAGRGYSFTVYPDQPPTVPLHMAARRVACTPLGGPADGLRVAGMMEFRPPDAPLDPRRIEAIIAAASPMLTGIDWSARTDEWVGPRPCTTDGLPLIGRTASERVYVAGGHGMWGIALGPLSGKLLAEQIAGGPADPLMAAFDPLRR